MSLSQNFNKFTPENMLRLVRLQMPQVVSNRITSVYPSTSNPSSYTVKFDYSNDPFEEAKFEEIFGIYWDNGVSSRGLLSILISMTHFILGILLFIGVIINCFSAFMNKKQALQICFFA